MMDVCSWSIFPAALPNAGCAIAAESWSHFGGNLYLAKAGRSWLTVRWQMRYRCLRNERTSSFVEGAVINYKDIEEWIKAVGISG